LAQGRGTVSFGPGLRKYEWATNRTKFKGDTS
jgi:hypothetical protein